MGQPGSLCSSCCQDSAQRTAVPQSILVGRSGHPAEGTGGGGSQRCRGPRAAVSVRGPRAHTPKARGRAAPRPLNACMPGRGVPGCEYQTTPTGSQDGPESLHNQTGKCLRETVYGERWRAVRKLRRRSPSWLNIERVLASRHPESRLGKMSRLTQLLRADGNHVAVAPCRPAPPRGAQVWVGKWDGLDCVPPKDRPRSSLPAPRNVGCLKMGLLPMQSVRVRSRRGRDGPSI